MKFRIEHDSMGPLQVPEDALYQAQTQRAVQNFQLHPATMPAAFIRALLLIKQAAARANLQLGLLSATQADAIVAAVDQQLQHLDLAQFPVSLYQTGSGTSSNMNANEVLATLASRLLGEAVNANDHVNCGQSSNDAFPTAMHIAVLEQWQEACRPRVGALRDTLAQRFDGQTVVITHFAPSLHSADPRYGRVPGTAGQPHRTLRGGHFVHEDDPEGFVQAILEVAG